MAHLRKSLRLSTSELWLLVKATLLLETIKLSMRLLPLQTFLRLSSRVTSMSTRRSRCADRASIDRVAWAVEVASRHTFGTKTCLNQALAAQMLLARRGYPALLHIGVAKGKEGRFQAHAWVESEGKVVIGGSGVECFTPLAVLEGKGLKNFRAKKALT